jgi:hypothetical protein
MPGIKAVRYQQGKPITPAHMKSAFDAVRSSLSGRTKKHIQTLYSAIYIFSYVA